MIRRLWEHPKLIPVLSVLTVIALAAAAFAVFGVLAADDARERDRISADYAACQRSNTIRLQLVALGEANADMIETIIDVVLPMGSTTRVDEIRDRLEPVLAEHEAQVDEIKLVDCVALTPGTRPRKPTEG